MAGCIGVNILEKIAAKLDFSPNEQKNLRRPVDVRAGDIHLKETIIAKKSKISEGKYLSEE